MNFTRTTNGHLNYSLCQSCGIVNGRITICWRFAIPLIVLFVSVSCGVRLFAREDLSQVASSESPQLVTFAASPGITEVTGLNRHGALMGRREVAVPGGWRMDYFVRTEGQIHPVPVPESYTNIELSVLSDSGWIAGYATRPLGDPVSGLRALLLHVESREIVLLPLPAGARDSCAHDLSADGQRVSGYVIGRDPPRLYPVVWTRSKDEWKCDRLPSPMDYNPLLVSARVVMSDDGRTAAASLATGLDEFRQPEYSLFLFKDGDGETFQESSVAPYAVHLADVNNRGQLAGRVLIRGKKRPFLYDPVKGAKELPIPNGASHVYVTDLNQAGDAVGVAEDPPGPEGSSQAVLWVDGELAELPFGVPLGASTAQVITNQRRVAGMLQRLPAKTRTPSPSAADSLVQQAGDQNKTGNEADNVGVQEVESPDELPTEGYLLQLAVPASRTDR